MARSRVELFEQIRKDRRVGRASIRELAERHRVHRRTVRQALESAVPPPRRPYPQRPRPAIDAYAAVIDGWLLADREVPRKQRHTARRVWQRLVAEHGATCSEVTVSRYVARRRAELGLDRVEVAVPPSHEPGEECLCGKPHSASAPGSQSATRTVARRAPRPWPSTTSAYRCSVRSGTTTPCRASSSPAFTTVRP